MDGTRSFSVVYDAVAGASIPAGVVIADGSIDAADYERYFGLAPVGETVVSFMLFDLPEELDAGNAAFHLVVKGYPSGEGTPDPDAVGVFKRECGCSE
jgi:hypothetical protein